MSDADLVEKNRRRGQYRDFLRSEFWQRLRVLALERDGYRCCFCGCERVVGLDVHHVRYPADWYQTGLGDVVSICRRCHRRQHNKPVVPLAKLGKDELRAMAAPVKVVGVVGVSGGKQVVRVETQRNLTPPRTVAKRRLVEALTRSV